MLYNYLIEQLNGEITTINGFSYNIFHITTFSLLLNSQETTLS